MRVVSVGFAPVKGTRWATYDAVTLDRHGPVGDRAFCLVDVAARQVLRTVQNPTLLAVRSHWDGRVLELALPSGGVASAPAVPSGERVTCDYWGRPADLALLDGPHAALASAWLGRPVRLAAAPRGAVVYGAPVSVVSLASLRILADHVERPDLATAAARLRGTVVIDGDEPFAERTWVGRTLRLGEATVRVHEPIPRCAVIDLDPATGVASAPILKALGSLPRTTPGLDLGVDAHVVEPGVVRPGDSVVPS
ncbi:MOSC domain-containing protein [Nocardioides sp. MAHUQ-72]|uniref:MOSC domain-containing protein n=1 Tax=unclassified Nocardioides TaxID=2615069 RepID=UPI003609D5A3